MNVYYTSTTVSSLNFRYLRTFFNKFSTYPEDFPIMFFHTNLVPNLI